MSEPAPGGGRAGRPKGGGRAPAIERARAEALARGDMLIVGWREYVALPDWGIQRILAKSDTGAASSALDVGHLEVLPGDRVAFDVVTSRRREDAVVHVVADIVRRTRVRSSLGHPHDRIFVATTMVLGGIAKTIELGLVDRARMRCRMLLGRRTLKPEFLVDSGHAYLLGRRPRMPRGHSSSPPSPADLPPPPPAAH